MKTVFLYKQLTPDEAAAKKKALLRIFADALKEQQRLALEETVLPTNENPAHESLYQTSGGIT